MFISPLPSVLVEPVAFKAARLFGFSPKTTSSGCL
jgi:hypothetical protein